jgi:hypothetical protein
MESSESNMSIVARSSSSSFIFIINKTKEQARASATFDHEEFHMLRFKTPYPDREFCCHSENAKPVVGISSGQPVFLLTLLIIATSTSINYE